MGELDPALTAQGYITQGCELRRQLGASYVSVGFAWATGAFHASSLKGNSGHNLLARTELLPWTLHNNRPGEIGHILEQVGHERFYLDLRTAPPAVREWAKTPYYRGWAGFGVISEAWQVDPEEKVALLPSHDFLVFFRTLSPSHLWSPAAKTPATASGG